MRTRSLLLALLALAFATPLVAQLRPASRWALGLGFSRLSTSGGLAAESAIGISGLYAPMLSQSVGIEVEGRAMFSQGSTECVPMPDVICEDRTLVPSEVVGVDARLAWVPDPRFRFSAGPALAWAPNSVGHGTDGSVGLTAGVGLSPLHSTGRGLGLELRATRFFDSLAEVEWVLGTALSFRF